MERGGEERIFFVASLCYLECCRLCLPQNYRDRCVSSMCVHIRSMLCMFLCRETESIKSYVQ